MNPQLLTRWLPILCLGWMLLAVGQAQAAVTDISNNPLSTASGTVVRPNVMFVLDDSGSMKWNYMPDYVNTSNKCRTGNSGRGTASCSGLGTNTGGGALEDGGAPPVFNYQMNSVYYNPNVLYTPPVNPCDISQTLPSMNGTNSSGWKSVRIYGHQINATTCAQESASTNILSQYPELYYCNGNSRTDCKRNGKDLRDPGTDAYDNGNGDYDWPYRVNGVSYTTARTVDSNPHYYIIDPLEYCTDSTLVDCRAERDSAYNVPAYIRYCVNSNRADQVAVVSGAGLCRAKYQAGTYPFARYGKFRRIDILPDRTFAKAVDRLDCAGTSCSYAEEMTNFANWYAYYRTRMMTMKSAAGQAFATIDNNYRVGFITINPGSGSVRSDRYLKIADFEPAHKKSWYQKFYTSGGDSGTPLREALARVGRHYAGITNGINNGMPEDPVQFACQQNFAILTTDGYWNNNGGQDLSGRAIENEDSTDAGYSKRSDGAYDGGPSVGGVDGQNRPISASGTLADVAMYYYKTDLRPNMEDKVPTTTKDRITAQHMNTFTLGLGLDGELDYRPDYELASEGAFAEIKQGLRNWPIPADNAPSTLDDLWHAAVNGRGLYFSAKQPKELISGLRSALAGVSDRTGAASASATSSPNITQTDNRIYSSTYRSVYWDGQIVAQVINPADGVVSDAIAWSAQAQINGQGGGSADSRRIFKYDSESRAIEPFQWDNLSDAERLYFSTKCESMSQCRNLTSDAKVVANNGQQLLNYLRGQSANSGEAVRTDRAFRLRANLLGDTVNSAPAYVKQPRFNFVDNVTPNYQSFKNDQATRHGTLYLGANDGMLHAINAETGAERWAYIPHSVMPNMYKLADKNYGESHQYMVDGSPQAMDVFDSTTSTWRTVLVTGLNAGGRGYTALDVTDEDNPRVLWEFCHSSAYCRLSDTDLGYTYGNPVIAKLPTGNANAGRWVVMFTSGYNNVSPGNGQGYLYIVDAITGALIQKLGTGVGTTETPSGFAKLATSSGVNGNADIDASAVAVYGGDLVGNLWKVNLTSSSATIARLAYLTDPAGVGQPLTTKPEVGKVPSVTDPIVFVATGRYLGLTDITNTQRQTVYAIRDNGTLYTGRNLTPRTITQGGTSASVSGTSLDWGNGGWYADLPESRERVNIDPQLALGTLLVVSNTPQIDNVNAADNGCAIGGSSWVYQFDFRTGMMIPGSTTLGVKMQSGVSVGVVMFRLPNGQLKAVITDARGQKTTIGVQTSASDGVSRRTGWRELTR